MKRPLFVVLFLLSAICCELSTAKTVYVSSYGTGDVLRYDATTGSYIDTFITEGLTQPHGVLDRGADLLVASAVTDQILRFDRNTGELLGEFIGPGDGIDYPVYMAIGPDGYLYVSSQLNDSILRFDAQTGAPAGTLVTSGSGGLVGPSGFAFDGDRLYVAGRFSDNVLAYDAATGAFEEEILSAADGLADGTTFGLQIADNGDLYVASNGHVRRWNLTTEVQTEIAVGFAIGLEPHPDGGMTFAAGNNLRRINTSTNSVSSNLLGPGGTISTLNFFHYSTYEGVPGDFNSDGTVDAADYTVWRNNLGSTATLGGNGFELGPSAGLVDGMDYWLWKENFGATTIAALAVAHSVPEAGSMALVALVCSLLIIHRMVATSAMPHHTSS